MGHVYRANDLALDRMVALKILARDQAADNETLRRFRNEARSAARLNHENIVQVFHAGEDQGLPYIAFEFIEGTNIREMVEKRGALSLPEAISYTFQIAEALEYTAAQGVVHRDIKPSNILITPEGRAKLIDMGLARMHAGAGSGGDLTASGVTLGTFDYISPEQARDPRNADVRSDIYSLGCTLFFMLAGRPPFPEGTVLQKLLQHQGDEPPDIRSFRPDLPDEVARVLRRMMAKSPQHRYQSPAKLIESLVWLAQLIGLRPTGPGHRLWVVPAEPEISFLERHLPWMAPVGILVLVVMVLHFLWDQPVAGPQLAGPSVARHLQTMPTEPAVAPTVPKTGETAPDAVASDRQPPARESTPAVPTPPTSSGQPATDVARQTTSTTEQATASLPPVTETDAPDPSAPAESVALNTRPEVFGIGPDPLEGELIFPEHSPPGFSLALPAEAPPDGLSGAAGGVGVLPTVDNTVPVPRSGVLVVDGAGAAANTYATLKAACSAATSGDVIELRYNGPREESPLELAGLKIKICSGEGFTPSIAFRPKSTDIDPWKYPRSMLTLTGSRLTIANVGLELAVPRDLPPDSWSLFEIGQAETVRIEKCWLTIRSRAAYHPDVAFLRLKANPAAVAALGDPLSLARRVTVDMVDCVARGEANFLHSETMQSVDISWENGLLTTTEWFLVADGGEEAPPPSNAIQVNLEHLTAAVGRGLCQLNQGEFTVYQLPVEIRCAASIFVGSGAAALIEQNGVANVASAEDRVLWDGDHNFYQGFTVFWTISPLNPSQPSEQKTFDAWQKKWTPYKEKQPFLDAVGWRGLPAADQPVSAHTPSDYGLDQNDQENPALRTAGEAGPAGLSLDRLPPAPPPVLLEPETNSAGLN